MQVLREYQVRADAAVREAFKRGSNAVLLVMPTGAGKTSVFAHWIMGAINKGSHVIFICHRRELVAQASARLTEHFVPHGVIQSGSRPDYNQKVQVASIQSLLPRLYPRDPETAPEPPKADILVFDEAHRATANSNKKAIAFFPNAKVAGLSATPARTDGRGLGDVFDALVEVIDVAELIDLGYLCDYVIFEGKYEAPDENLSLVAGDFDEAEASARLDTDDLVGDVYSNWKARADGKRTIVFAQSRKHGRHITDVFVQAGENFKYIDGNTPAAERDRTIREFSEGLIRGIVNVGILVEGFDVPGIECVVLAFMTASIIKYRQAVGRGLRPFAGKDRLIINDHGGNARHRFGGPDFPHEWSLDGRKKRAAPVQPSLTTCPVCRAGIRSQTRVCPECGEVLITVSRGPDVPDTTPGMLVEANYKIKRSEAEEKKSAAAQREMERELKKQAKLAAEQQAVRELEIQRKFLQETVALAARKNYSLEYPIKEFKKRFKSEKKPFGFWPGAKQGVSINWVNTGKVIPSTGKYAMKIAGFTIDGVSYGDVP